MYVSTYVCMCQSADAVHEDGSTEGASHLLEDSDDDLEFTLTL